MRLPVTKEQMEFLKTLGVEDKEYTKEVLEVSNHIPLIALPNDSFIRIENNNIEFVGTYYLIENNKIITKQK